MTILQNRTKLYKNTKHGEHNTKQSTIVYTTVQHTMNILQNNRTNVCNNNTKHN